VRLLYNLHAGKVGPHSDEIIGIPQELFGERDLTDPTLFGGHLQAIVNQYRHLAIPKHHEIVERGEAFSLWDLVHQRVEGALHIGPRPLLPRSLQTRQPLRSPEQWREAGHLHQASRYAFDLLLKALVVRFATRLWFPMVQYLKDILLHLPHRNAWEMLVAHLVAI
jgi:hypothetical protein